ncbi:MAG: hypothetical protein MdMp014T_0238 [Treponematales bacterium]
MADKKPGRWGERLADRFVDVWQLLSETSLFLSRAGELENYESEMRALRRRLQNAPHNQETAREARAELTALRQHLRLQGYDLSLARHNLVFDGFRHDDAERLGFRRVVLYITSREILWQSGAENHAALAGYLDHRLDAAGAGRPAIRGRHYLWYLRRGRDLILSGGATESKEDYETLRASGEANPLFYLACLKGLR